MTENGVRPSQKGCHLADFVTDIAFVGQIDAGQQGSPVFARSTDR
jgi:hypothetical protein